jgi:signal transduction histidine kinase
MLISTSEEFVTLCRSQVTILTEGLGAALSVVYLTKELTEAVDTKLVPVVSYPEAVANWDAEQVLAILSRNSDRNSFQRRLLDSETAALAALALPGDVEASGALPTVETALQQIVLPLIHEDVVMGLLVTARADRPWNSQESAEVEQIAQTIAIAYVLDQRAQWVEQELRQQRSLQTQQHDVFDDLLHQFRNPLTALRTFGKLLMRRLLPEDANRDVAVGIVRESDRLQELLKQFDTAVDLGGTSLLTGTTSQGVGTAQIESPLIESPLSEPLAAQPKALPSAHYLTGAALQLEPHKMAEVLEPLLIAAMAIAQERQIDLQVMLLPNLPAVQVDLKAFREVLTNLIDNALKYTPAGGKVYIRTGLQYSSDYGNRQGIAIVDTGPGIPIQDQTHLFERRYRGVQAHTDIPGSGLGLAIARDLLDQMQGEIQIFSPAEDSGLVGLATPSAQFPGTALIVWLPEIEPGRR